MFGSQSIVSAMPRIRNVLRGSHWRPPARPSGLGSEAREAADKGASINRQLRRPRYCVIVEVLARAAWFRSLSSRVNTWSAKKPERSW